MGPVAAMAGVLLGAVAVAAATIYATRLAEPDRAASGEPFSRLPFLACDEGCQVWGEVIASDA